MPSNITLVIILVIVVFTPIVYNMIENDFWREKDKSDERDDSDS